MEITAKNKADSNSFMNIPDFIWCPFYDSRLIILKSDGFTVYYGPFIVRHGLVLLINYHKRYLPFLHRQRVFKNQPLSGRDDCFSLFSGLNKFLSKGLLRIPVGLHYNGNENNRRIAEGSRGKAMAGFIVKIL
jgi:hypothetical protein